MHRAELSHVEFTTLQNSISQFAGEDQAETPHGNGLDDRCHCAKMVERRVWGAASILLFGHDESRDFETDGDESKSACDNHDDYSAEAADVDANDPYLEGERYHDQG